MEKEKTKTEPEKEASETKKSDTGTDKVENTSKEGEVDTEKLLEENKSLKAEVEELKSSTKGLKDSLEKTNADLNKANMEIQSLKSAYQEMFVSTSDNAQDNKEEEKIPSNLFEAICNV